MAVSVDYQTWDSATYNWLDKTTSTGAPLQIADKLDAWIAAVNANASNTTKQVTRRKGPADSTSANFIGWVIECSSGTPSAGLFAHLYSNSTSNLVAHFSPGWSNDGNNGGYGGPSAGGGSDTSVLWATSGVIGEFSIASSADDGQEFFCLGWRLGNDNAKSDQFLIFKGANGEWCSLFSDGGSVMGTYYMNAHSTPARTYFITLPTIALNGTASYLSRLVLNTTVTTYAPTTSVEWTGAMTAPNPAIYMTTNSADFGYGRWSNLVDGRKAVCMGFGPIWIVF